MLFAWQPAGEADLERLAKEAASQRARLCAKLADEKLWSEPENEKELLACLKAARVFPDPKLVAMLAPRIAYSPYTVMEPLKPIEDLAPVYGVLLNIGLPALPAAVERLKHVDPDSDDARLLTRLLVKVYDQAGFGKDIAIQRLELELSRTKAGKERANLQGALKWLRRGIDTKGKT
jgi:hypothetical protein